MKNTETKVFCSFCKYFANATNQCDEKCLAPENRRDTYKSPKAELAQKPYIINHQNSCPYFVQKQSKYDAP